MLGRRHQHAHEAVAVYHQSASLAAALGMATVPAATVILWRCPCRNVDSQTLAGRWTLAQIRGEVPTDEQMERIETALTGECKSPPECCDDGNVGAGR